MSHTIPHPRLLLLSLALGGFAIGITEFATMGLIPYIAAGLGISEPTAGHLISAYALGVVVGAPSIAVLAARMSRRTLLLCLMGAFALGHIATALADNYSSLLVWRFLSGLPHGAYFGVGALGRVISAAGQTRASGGHDDAGPHRGLHHRRAADQLDGPSHRLAGVFCDCGGAGSGHHRVAGAFSAETSHAKRRLQRHSRAQSAHE